MKKMICIALSLVLLVCLLPTAAFAQPWTEDWESMAKELGIRGNGQENEPYCISEDSQLKAFLQKVASGEGFYGVFFQLTKDVVSREYCEFEDNGSDGFMGRFDGNGHSVELDLEIDGGSDEPAALFPRLASDGVIKNLTLTGSAGGHRDLGGICGCNMGRIINCTNQCNLTATGMNCGGICYDNQGIIENCVNEGKMSAYNAGGICRFNYRLVNAMGGVACEGTIINCVNYGEIESEGGSTGSICGQNDGGIIENCYFSAGVDNGFGTKLSDEQTKAQSGAEGALIDLLNAYKAENDEKGEWLSWTMSDKGYPQPDYSEFEPMGSILSAGYPEIVYGIGGIAVVAFVVLLISHKKKVAESNPAEDGE